MAMRCSIRSGSPFGWLARGVAWGLLAGAALQAEEISADVVVYKASPGGIMAAVAAARAGASVVLAEPTAYVGGIVAQGGLCASDVGDYSTIGGLSLEFFHRVGGQYKAAYGAASPQYRDTFIGKFEGGQFEPKVAEAVFEGFLKEQPKIRLLRGAVLAGVDKDGTRLRSLTCRVEGTAEPVVLRGAVFVDASYAGDVMAAAKVSYFLGSESREQFGESLGREQAGPQIQACNYRVTMTNLPDNRVAVPQPDGYDPVRYNSLVARIVKNPVLGSIFQPFWKLPNQKQDTNLADLPEKNWAYPEADPATRRQIEQEHRAFVTGYLYCMQNDPRLPEAFRAAAGQWGLAKDEFADNGNFPREIYIREARRLNGAYVLRQSDLQQARRKPDGIAIGTYGIDCHATQNGAGKAGNGGLSQPVRPYDIPYRVLTPQAAECENLLVPVCLSATHVAWASVRMEPVFMMTGEAAGTAAALAVAGNLPVQQVPVEALQAALKEKGGLLAAPVEPIADFDWEPRQPQPGEAVRFFVKPVEGAPPAVACNWDFDGTGTAQSREAEPRHAFAKDKATLVTLVVEDAAGKKSCPVSKIVPVGAGLPGDAQVDSEDPAAAVAERVNKSAAQLPFYGTCFFHDGRANKGQSHVAYTAQLSRAGTYAVYLSSSPGGRAKNALVEVEGTAGKQAVRVDQNAFTPLFGMVYVGDFEFGPDAPARVTIRNDGTDGYVVYDVVRWILK